MTNKGYLTVLKPELVIQQFEQRDNVKDYPEYYKKLRNAFRSFDPLKYRGISRYPLEAYPSLDQNELDYYAREGVDLYSDKNARMKLLEIVPETTPDFYDVSFIENCTDALEIFKLLDEPQKWEIIQVRRDTFEEIKHTLGFDIGYWSSDHFSLIADTIVIPMWHVPDEKDYAELEARLRHLNKNLLFKTPKQATDFKIYYKSKEWAETEDIEGEFCVIQVDEVII